MVIKIRLIKILTKGGKQSLVMNVNHNAGGVAGDAFELCFHDAGNFMPEC